MEDYSKPRYMSQDAIAGEQQRFMVRVYNWMGSRSGPDRRNGLVYEYQ